MRASRDWLTIAPLVVLLTAYIMAGFAFARYMLSLLAPDMIAAGVIGYDTLAVMTAANQVGYLSFSFLGGVMARHIDPKRLVVASVGLIGVLLCVLGVARHPLLIGVIVTVLGALTATGWVPMIRVVQHAVPARLHGSALGVVASGTAYGTVITGLLVPVINEAFDWRASWMIFGAAAVLLMLAGLRLVPSVPGAPAAGAATSADAGGAQGGFGNLRTLLRQARGVFMMMFLSGGGLTVFLTYFVPFLRADLGLSAELAGFAWSLVGISGMASGIVIGRLADRTSVRAALIHGHLIMLAAIALMVVWPTTAAVMLAACLFGLGYFGTFGMFPAYIAKTVPASNASALYGTGNLCMGCGAALFNFLGGTIKSTTGSFEVMFMLSCAITLAIMALAARLPSDRRDVPAAAGA